MQVGAATEFGKYRILCVCHVARRPLGCPMLLLAASMLQRQVSGWSRRTTRPLKDWPAPTFESGNWCCTFIN